MPSDFMDCELVMHGWGIGGGVSISLVLLALVVLFDVNVLMRAEYLMTYVDFRKLNLV